MRDLNDLMYFAAVVEHGGFTAASRAMGLPKSTLSRRVSELEARLQVRLLHRSTRRLVVTEIGQQFYKHCKAMLVEADAAETVVQFTHAEPCGNLHVSCPIALLHMQVSEMLTAFVQLYPLVRLQISAVNRPVDVIAEGIDIALRVRTLPLSDSALAMRKLGESPQCLVASPQLFSRLELPQTPFDLKNWPALGNGDPAERHTWSLMNNNAAEPVDITYLPRLATTDMHTLRQAVLMGLGIAQLPALFVQDELHAGHLVQVLPDWRAPSQIIHAIFASRRGLVSSVRALLDHLVAGFAQEANGVSDGLKASSFKKDKTQ